MKSRNKETTKYVGTYIANQKGFGFVEIEGMEEDLFIPEGNTHGAFHMDTVEVHITKEKTSDKRAEGKIDAIIMRGITDVVGTFDKAKSYGFVIPDNQKLESDIFVAKEDSMGAVTGHKVVCHITDYGDRRRKPEGKITEIIGHENDPGVDIISIVKGFDLPSEFPEKVLNQANRVAKDLIENDFYMRRDLRDMLMVTIDGEDSKDLDDAVSLSYEDGIYHLGVHIADVSNYVQESSALDKEALNRGTSVYLVDRVIPMLPHALSNGICSLNMGEDRLALSCLMDIDEKGQVVNHEIIETVINVNERMNYSDVNRILTDNDKQLRERYAQCVPMFELMEKLSHIIRKNREKRGSIDFDIPESKIILNKHGVPVKIAPYERGVSQKIIEDFMLMANETVAEHFYYLESPFVYRTHGTPAADKILKLGTFINNFGYSIKVRGAEGEVHPKEIQKLLAKIEGTPEEALISRLTLRSMQRAEYNTACLGHFGLACNFYCHFTSPIRRYPDLQIHRIIKEHIHGRMNEKKIEHFNSILPMVAKESSAKERRADEAEREVEKLKKAQYMLDHIGEQYDGVISGITVWGIYVELPNTVEGMIHVSKLMGDYYYYKEDTYEMIGQKTGIVYKLGQKVKIVVDYVDMSVKTIDFSFVEPTVHTK
ncbi:MAG: ribonuclease R [Lachnospiraceae bacterium]|nr:ribonuclease R [Lachnospiraceae bacterium]